MTKIHKIEKSLDFGRKSNLGHVLETEVIIQVYHSLFQHQQQGVRHFFCISVHKQYNIKSVHLSDIFNITQTTDMSCSAIQTMDSLNRPITAQRKRNCPPIIYSLVISMAVTATCEWGEWGFSFVSCTIYKMTFLGDKVIASPGPRKDYKYLVTRSECW